MKKAVVAKNQTPTSTVAVLDRPIPEPLVRKPLVPKTIAESVVVLAEQVRAVLGYRTLAERAGSGLPALLTKLDIHPFDPATVTAYQTKLVS